MRFGRSRVRLYAKSYNYKSYDHGVTITFLFSMSFDKQIIVKSYLQLGEKSPNPVEEQEKTQCFYQYKKSSSPVKRIK